MKHGSDKYDVLPVGVVMQRTPGVTAWAKWSWTARAVLPGAQPAHWVEMRRDGETTEYHAGTLDLELHRADTEAYLHGLHAKDPSVYIILREGAGDAPLDLVLLTVSPYEAQDYADSGEEIIEKVPMPPALRAWVEDFVEKHHQEETFIKRKRDKKRIDLRQDGIGDARVSRGSDVYASPRRLRERLQ
ncbi:DUF3305 domain-containing protein [Roseobacter sp. CCS2]|uniref:DUF3305 domain-containing protein n=1 Tax=Roseobacter sp. CCS2 TaxID=391593 RepID=UPI0022B3CEAD|nr:DUF3305 domain-containing protein [Roseobacter sp. CCS2]